MKERDGTIRPSGHFRRGVPGDAPYSKNRGFYNPYVRPPRKGGESGPCFDTELAAPPTGAAALQLDVGGGRVLAFR